MKINHRQASSLNNPGSTRRPFGVTILILAVLIFSSSNTLRMITAIRTRNFLKDAPLVVPIAYLVISGAIWMGVGFVLLYGLWTRRTWSPIMAMTLVVLYSCYYWVDKLIIADPSSIAGRWLFSLGFNLVILSITFWTLTRPRTRAFFIK